MGEGAFGQVADLLVEQQGIDLESIHPQSRLIEDLRMWGDDIADFFLAVEKRFGTDLGLLWTEWDRHFPPEGPSWKGILVSLPTILIGGIAGGFAVAATGLPEFWVYPVAALLAFGALWLVSRLVRGPETVPVTVAEVAAAITRGRWESKL